MKNIRIAILACLLLSGGLLVAQGLSLQLRGSYNIPSATSVLESAVFVDSLGNAVEEENLVSLGAGLTFGIDATYQFNPHFGLQLGFQYLVGRRTRALVSDQDGFLEINSEAYTRQGQVTIGGIVSTGGDPVDVYGRFGFLLPVFGVTNIEVDFNAPFLNTHEFTRAEVSGRFSLGFYGGMGARYAISDQIGISLEAVFSNLRINANQAIVVEKTDLITGESILEDQATSNVTTNYFTELDENSNNPEYNSDFDNTMPREELTYSSNYSNLAIQLGLGFSFGK